VRSALATLPWVETNSIVTDRDSTQVRFTLKDRSQYDFEQVKSALKKDGYAAGVKVLTGPTDS